MILRLAFGLEYARPIPPNILMIGRVGSNDALKRVDKNFPILFLEDLPVIYVDLGKYVSSRTVEMLVNAFTSSEFKVLWKLDSNLQKLLPSIYARFF